MRGEILAVLGRTSYEESCHCPLRGETGLLEVELMAWWEESQPVQVSASGEGQPLTGREGLGKSRCDLEVLKGES